MMKLLRNTVAPLALILCTPSIVMLLWYMNTSLHGSLGTLWHLFQQNGFFQTLYDVWSPIFFGSPTAWKILAIFATTQLLLIKLIPGKLYKGPLTPKGNIPTYKANGPAAFLITLTLFFSGSLYFELFPLTIIYDNFGPILGALNLFSLLFCLFLLIKGMVLPSSSDSGSSGNILFDYYWGTELYPRIFGWDVKLFTNCRSGMMGWGLIIISFAAKQKALYGVVSDSMMVCVGLQLIYILKFFIWETGYLNSLDIMHDRAGYYICWGCLVWLPGLYTSPTLYLVQHPNHLGVFWSILIFTLGTICILTNYLADRQRQRVRSKSGNCTIWNKKPLLTQARYVTSNGEIKETILLASGWWGISRHFHYVPEILGTFFWTVPALFISIVPYFYLIFLIILLTDRAFRDEKRCSEKYGEDWTKHCELVRYKIIPFVL